MSAFNFPSNPNISDVYTANNVAYICTGVNPAVWKKLGSDITTGATKVAVIKDKKNKGVEGGLFVQDGWRDRDLTVKDDPFNFVTLYPTTNGQTTPGNGGSNASTGAADYKGGYFSLPAGKYRIKFRAPAGSVNEHMAAIGWRPNESDINKTYAYGDFNSGGEIYGSSEALIMNNNTNVNKFVLTSNFSEGSGIVEISEINYFKVIHYGKKTSQNSSGANENYGFGKSVNIGNIDEETYTIIEVEDLSTIVNAAPERISKGNTLAQVIDTGTDGHLKVLTEGAERLHITSDGDAVLAHTAPASTYFPGGNVLGGGIYTRTINMGDPSASNGQAVSVTRDFFKMSSVNAAMAGTIYVTVNGSNLSCSAIYLFATYAGNNASHISAPVAQSGFASYNFSLSIAVSGTFNEERIIRVVNTYTKNSHGVPGDYGPDNPCVNVTMVLGAGNKGITVTRP